METTTATTDASAGGAGAHLDVTPARVVVAVVVEWRGRVALLRRGRAGDHLGGRWDCVTAGMPSTSTVEQQALHAVFEATHLKARSIDSLDALGALDVADSAGERWQVHVFRAVTRQRRLVLGPDHDAHRWVQPAAVPRFGNRVPWLDGVIGAVTPLSQEGREAPGS